MKEIANISIEELYNSETADDIAKRKGLRYHEDILDNMGEEVEKYQKHNEYIKLCLLLNHFLDYDNCKAIYFL